MYAEAGEHRKHVICDEVKAALSGREDEPLLDVACGTGLVGHAVSHFILTYYIPIEYDLNKIFPSFL